MVGPSEAVVKVRIEWDDDENKLANLASAIDRATPLVIGRTVHYRSRGSADEAFPPTCVAAILTKIETHSVSLAVLNPSGLFFDSGLLYDKSRFVGGTWHYLSDCVFDS